MRRQRFVEEENVVFVDVASFAVETPRQWQVLVLGLSGFDEYFGGAIVPLSLSGNL